MEIAVHSVHHNGGHQLLYICAMTNEHEGLHMQFCLKPLGREHSHPIDGRLPRQAASGSTVSVPAESPLRNLHCCYMKRASTSVSVSHLSTTRIFQKKGVRVTERRCTKGLHPV